MRKIPIAIGIIGCLGWSAMMLLAPQTASRIAPYVFGFGLIGLATSAATSVVLARRRGLTVAQSLRPDAHALNSLQDDLLGRLPWSPPPTQTDSSPVSTIWEEHEDPQGDITRAPRRPG